MSHALMLENKTFYIRKTGVAIGNVISDSFQIIVSSYGKWVRPFFQ